MKEVVQRYRKLGQQSKALKEKHDELTSSESASTRRVSELESELSSTRQAHEEAMSSVESRHADALRSALADQERDLQSNAAKALTASEEVHARVVSEMRSAMEALETKQSSTQEKVEQVVQRLGLG